MLNTFQTRLLVRFLDALLFFYCSCLKFMVKDLTGISFISKLCLLTIKHVFRTKFIGAKA